MTWFYGILCIYFVFMLLLSWMRQVVSNMLLPDSCTSYSRFLMFVIFYFWLHNGNGPCCEMSRWYRSYQTLCHNRRVEFWILIHMPLPNGLVDRSRLKELGVSGADIIGTIIPLCLFFSFFMLNFALVITILKSNNWNYLGFSWLNLSFSSML